MFCKNCGCELPDNVQYCVNCGAKVKTKEDKNVVDNPEGDVGSEPKKNIKKISFIKYILLSAMTLGIYSIYVWYGYVKDINEVCKDDTKKSPNYIIVMLLSLVTFGIYGYYWYYVQGERLHKIGPKYGVTIREKGSTLLLWSIIGAIPFGIGVFVRDYIMLDNMNWIALNYNGEKTVEEVKELGQPHPKLVRNAIIIMAAVSIIIIGGISMLLKFSEDETLYDISYEENIEQDREKVILENEEEDDFSADSNSSLSEENREPVVEEPISSDEEKIPEKSEESLETEESILTDPVTMGWAGAYKDDETGERLIIAAIGYDWSYCLYMPSGEVFQEETDCDYSFDGYLSGQYYTFCKNENGLLGVTSGAGGIWGNFRRISGTNHTDAEIEGQYGDDSTTITVSEQMVSLDEDYVPGGSDIAAIQITYNNGLVINARLYTQQDHSLAIVDSVNKNLYGIITFRGKKAIVQGSNFDGVYSMKENQ